VIISSLVSIEEKVKSLKKEDWQGERMTSKRSNNKSKIRKGVEENIQVRNI